MRKAVVVFLLLGLVAGSLAAPATAGKKKAKKRSREVVVAYTEPAIGSADGTGICAGVTGACPMLIPATTESYLSLEVADGSGTPPPITLGQDTNTGDNFVDRVGEVCGSTEEPIQITPGVQIIVWVWATPRFVAGGGPCLGFGTSGEITATFSNLP